jgi:phosphoethanolamine N-methyltransferase
MAHERQYSDAVLDSMESVYGEGFLSPGGAEEVAGILAGVAVAGRDVLDLGCGIGGASLMLARDLGAGRVLGIDVEAESIARAEAIIEAAGLTDRVAVQQVAPGPIPLPDGAYDVVFSKDVFCHVPDKTPLFAEALRVLRPGGIFAFGDWVKGEDGPGSAAYDDWAARLRATGLLFNFGDLDAYLGGLEAAGFADVELRDHSAWSAAEARRQLDHALGPAHESLRAALGDDGIETRIALTRSRAEALEGGALLHSHLQARRPA